MFVTDAEVEAVVADLLKVSLGSLPDHVRQVARRAHARAYNLIVRTLVGRGFTKAQVDQWDEGEDVERDLAAFLVGTTAGVIQKYKLDPKVVEVLDRREDLKTTPVLMISGEPVNPAGTVSLPRAGELDTTGDIFVWPDPDDANRGEVTDW